MSTCSSLNFSAYIYVYPFRVTTIYVLNKASALERTLTGVHKFYPPLAISKDLLFAKSRVEGESLGNLVVYDKKTGDSVFSWKPNCDIKSVALHNENILVASECESSGTTSLRINVLQLSLDVAFLVAIVSASVGGASFILGNKITFMIALVYQHT